jgi:hypothetical protein
MNHAVAERRRSDRLWLTFPLRIVGVDSKGQTFEYPGRAISLNRHGGRIQIPKRFDRGQPIRLRSPIGHYEGEFRVVETITGLGENSCECGVECLNHEYNFWGIEFPSEEDGALDAKGLLECGMCHTIALMPLAFLEIETLRTINMVGLDCPKCSEVTFWRYAEMRVPTFREREPARSSMDRQASWITSITESVERGHRRVYMHMPLGISDCCGNSDLVRTENISDCGFCFSSEREYLRGEIVKAAFPIASMTQLTQMPARIVREQVIEGSPSKIYGATFEGRNGGCHGD